MFKVIWFLRGMLYKVFFGKFGNFSYLGNPVFIKNFKRIFIGCRVRIFPGVRMEVLDSKSSIIFEDNISIGQNFHIISGGQQELKIGTKTTFSANVFVTNLDHDYKEIGVHIMQQNLMFRQTIIGKNCFIGYGAVIQAGTILGNQCVVGANSVVRGCFPDCCVIVGAPAKIVKRYDKENGTWKKTNTKGEFIDEV